MYQQEVVRFSQEAADKETGSYASNIRPQNIEEAIDKMRWHQHNHQAIYGRPRRKVTQVSPGANNGMVDGGEARVCVIGVNRGEEMSLKKETGEVLSAQGKQTGEIKSNLATLSAQMAVMMEEVKKSRVSGYRAPSRSPSPRREVKPGCYHCGEMGHFKEECPNYLGSPKREKRVFSRKLRGFKLQRGNSRGLSPPPTANMQGLKGSVEGEEVDRVVSPPILKRDRKEEQGAIPLWVTGELGSPTVKPPPGTRSPEGEAGRWILLGEINP